MTPPNNNFIPRGGITTGKVLPQLGGKNVTPAQKTSVETPFSELLKKEIGKNEDVKFSVHATRRMQSRDITLSQAELQSLNEAVQKAEQKGIKESLVVMNNVALIVNIKNKTVVTAVDATQMKENVFTNIDGAVFI